MSHRFSALPRRRGIIFSVVPVLAVFAAGIGWYVHAAGHATSETGGAASASASGTGILLGLAKAALSEHRLVAPAGSNAYEFYLSVLQLDPRNATAQDSLRTAFAAACNDVERAIDARDLDEAQRELYLLRDYDSTNYTLSLLGSKLSAQRSVMTREHEAQAAMIQAQAGAADPATAGGTH